MRMLHLLKFIRLAVCFEVQLFPLRIIAGKIMFLPDVSIDIEVRKHTVLAGEAEQGLAIQSPTD